MSNRTAKVRRSRGPSGFLAAIVSIAVGAVLTASPVLAEPNPRADVMREPKVGGKGRITSTLSPADRLSPAVESADPPSAPASPADCAALENPIPCENALPGSPSSEWDIPTRDAGDGTIAGFATQMSVNRGQQIDFKIRTDAQGYTIRIYRLGYYQGLGAREVASVTPTAALPQKQPACVFQPATDLVDCGNWGISASWSVPDTATSGVYSPC